MTSVPSSTPGPLNPGDVVSAAIQLYRDRFKTYIGLSTVATLWVALPFFALSVLAIVMVSLSLTNAAVWSLFVLCAIFLILYCWAKYSLYTGLLARLSFRELINEPETPAQARRQIAPKLWSYLGLSLLLLLIFIVAFIGIYIAAAIVGFTVAFGLGTLFNQLFGDTGAFIGGVLGGLLVFGGFIIGILWVASRFFIAEVPISVETPTGASESIGRSWSLTKKSIVRIQFVVVATYLAALPPALVFSIIPQFFLFRLEPGTTAYNVTYLLIMLGSVLISIATMPFWQAVKGVLYYDLRSRREGLDLSI
ncbi:MAG: hypothetical protein AAFV85_15035 [Cyanobacteria bacterium J06634_6]